MAKRIDSNYHRKSEHIGIDDPAFDVSNISSFNICLFSCCMQNANIKPFHNCSSALKEIAKTLYLIAVYQGDAPKISYDVENAFEIVNPSYDSRFLVIFGYLNTQIKILRHFFSIRHEVDVCVFYLGNISILQTLAAKIFRKKTVLLLGGCLEKEVFLTKDPFGKFKLLLQKLNLYMIDKIVIYSPRLIEEWNLKAYEEKISIAHEHSIDFSKLKLRINYNERKNLVGYIGRFSEEKGVLNFIQACSIVLEKEKNCKFLIGGSGHLQNEIEELIQKNKLSNNVSLVGWITHEMLPIYLNELKLIVLPSFSEGLPNTMLEAMACGTPVLATPVGSIPDYIIDQKTGFIMEANTPECIAKNILKVLNFSDVSKVADNAKSLVEDKFRPEVRVQKYREAFQFD